MVLVHHHRNVGMGFDGCQHQMTQIGFACVFARTCRRLQDHGAVSLLSSFHDGLHLLEVVDVESGDAIAMLGSMV